MINMMKEGRRGRFDLEAFMVDRFKLHFQSYQQCASKRLIDAYSSDYMMSNLVILWRCLGSQMCIMALCPLSLRKGLVRLLNHLPSALRLGSKVLGFSLITQAIGHGGCRDGYARMLLQQYIACIHSNAE